MKALRLVPLALVLAACSSVNVPLSPYRIDVQQGNALEQESVEKLKPGLTRSQVRFLLGTPLLVDPFHGNRWDYVYNFRKAGKLTEERRLALFFEGDALARIEAEGLTLGADKPAAKPAEPQKPAEKAVEQQKPAVVETAPAAGPAPLEPAKPLPAEVAPAAGQAGAATPSESATPAPAAAQETAARPAAPAAQAAEARASEETSIVRPLRAEPAQAARQAATQPPLPAASAPEPVALQAEADVEAIKPDVMPEFPAAASPASPEGQVAAAVKAWAEAWRQRDEDAYLAAYAASFRPAGGQTRAQWEQRRRLLLGVSRNIDLQIDGVAVEAVGEEYAQVSFRQFYRSDSYRDAVIKQLKFVRADKRWLIEEEKVLAPIKENR